MTTYHHTPKDPTPDDILGFVIIALILAFFLWFGVGCKAATPQGNVHVQFNHWWTLTNHVNGQVITHHPACPNPDHRKKK